MAITPANGDAPRSLKKMRRQGEREKGRRHSSLALLFFAFLACFAVRSSAQDLEPLEQAILSGNSEQKRDALYEIKKIATEQASRIAIPALRDPDVIVRATAASAVIYLPPAEAITFLHPLLIDKQEFVRREAAYALGEIGDPDATYFLTELLKRERVIEVRGAAIVAVGKLGDTSAIGPLVAILQKKPHEDTEFLRRSAARSIGQIAMRQQIGRTTTVTPQNFLPAKYKNMPEKLRDLTQATGGADSLANLFGNALQVLVRTVSSAPESIDTRREAAFAIGMIGSTTAVPVLTKYSSDPDPYLAEICKEALLKLQ